MDDKDKRKVGRPRIPENEKVIYQRVPIRYETYKKMKDITTKAGVTFSDLIEAFLQETKLAEKYSDEEK